MAKGDSVKVMLESATGPVEAGIAVMTRGRSIRRTDSTKAKVQWVTFAEVKPTGKATGDYLTVRLDAVLSITVREGAE